jgi:hypothetical protein
MKDFTFWYDETYIYKGGFQANSAEEAQELLEQVFSGEKDINDLPGFWNKDKGYESNYDLKTLQETED